MSIVPFLVQLALFVAVASAVKPKGHEINGRTVFLHSTKENWFKASEICRKQGLQLLTINSPMENLQVVRLGNNFGLDSVWTAATDFGESRRWVWSSSGRDVAELYWRDGEPTDITERCIEVLMVQYPSNWNDNDCNARRPFICEEVVELERAEGDGNKEVQGPLTLAEIFRRIG